MLTANMDGSEKFKPMVIGKFLNEIYLQGFNMCNLGAIYRANANGWMTGTIFKEWVYAFDKKMKGQNRQILLFVENFSGHSPNKGEAPYVLTNIKLHYFQANCTSVIQQMDQGIIQYLLILMKSRTPYCD